MFLLAAFAAGVQAQSNIGTEAPSLDGGKWIVGNPVANFRPGKVYVVAFWTSSVAEREGALATMKEISQTNTDSVVVCVSADGKEGDEFDELLKQKDLPANLRVVKDDPAETPGPVVLRWLSTVASDSYPVTFVIDKKGKIAFVGDVLEAKKLVPDVLSGKLTAEIAASEMEEAVNDADKARAELNGRPQQRAALGDNIGAAEAIDAVIAKYPRCREMLLFQKFYYLLQAQKFEEAYKVADELAEASQFNPMQLNELAWYIVDEEWITDRDLDRAFKISQRSNELSGNRVAACLDTLARVYFEQGNIESALELQTKAVNIARNSPRGEPMDELLAALERYKAVPLPK
jgi:tetratricopeptide (TPR) repeat protein